MRSRSPDGGSVDASAPESEAGPPDAGLSGVFCDAARVRGAGRYLAVGVRVDDGSDGRARALTVVGVTATADGVDLIPFRANDGPSPNVRLETALVRGERAVAVAALCGDADCDDVRWQLALRHPGGGILRRDLDRAPGPRLGLSQLGHVWVEADAGDLVFAPDLESHLRLDTNLDRPRGQFDVHEGWTPIIRFREGALAGFINLDTGESRFPPGVPFVSGNPVPGVTWNGRWAFVGGGAAGDARLMRWDGTIEARVEGRVPQIMTLNDYPVLGHAAWAPGGVLDLDRFRFVRAVGGRPWAYRDDWIVLSDRLGFPSTRIDLATEATEPLGDLKRPGGLTPLHEAGRAESPVAVDGRGRVGVALGARLRAGLYVELTPRTLTRVGRPVHGVRLADVQAGGDTWLVRTALAWDEPGTPGSDTLIGPSIQVVLASTPEHAFVLPQTARLPMLHPSGSCVSWDEVDAATGAHALMVADPRLEEVRVLPGVALLPEPPKP